MSESAEGITTESGPRLMFKLTLMRHEKPYYRDEGHDLTPEGVESAKNTGAQFISEGRISETDELYLLHSPKPRAEGTADFVIEGTGRSNVRGRSINQIRSSDIHNKTAFVEKIVEAGETQEGVARAHYVDEKFYNQSPQNIETNDHKKSRLYRALEYLIRWMNKHQQSKTPHVLAVSHFEIITHLIDDVFGIETFGEYNVPSFGEDVFIEAFSTDNPDTIRMEIIFRGNSKTVFFDRIKREVIIE